MLVYSTRYNDLSCQLIYNLSVLFSLPFEFELNQVQKDPKQESTLVVRQLEKEDVPTAVSMCLKEYGSYPSTASTKSDILSKKLDAQLTELENFMFSFIVLIGLGQSECKSEIAK